MRPHVIVFLVFAAIASDVFLNDAQFSRDAIAQTSEWTNYITMP